MAIYSIMSNIKHQAGSTHYTDSSGDELPLHEQQGTMDGACSVYSIIMALKLMKYISNEDVTIYQNLDRRTHKGKLLHELMESRGLVRQGSSFKELTKVIKSIYRDNIYVEHMNFKTNSSAIKQMELMVHDNWDGSIVLGMSYKHGGGHAVLFVGLEVDENGKTSKVLCLDPGCEESHIAPWNCYIDIRNRRGKYPFVCYDDKGCTSDNCNIDELIYIQWFGKKCRSY